MEEHRLPDDQLSDALDRIRELIVENERLKQEVTRLRNQIYDKSSSTMSSKLKDALRE